MTKISVKCKGDCFEIVSKGHSGYSDEGSDIVCASLSTALEMVMNMFDAFDVDFSLECDEDIPMVHITVDVMDNNSKVHDVKCIISGYVSFVSDLAEQYPKYTQITTEV